MMNQLSFETRLKSRRSSNAVAQENLSQGQWFFFWRTILLAIFPAENSYSRKEKNIAYLQKIAYVLLFTVSVTYGGISFVSKMQPLFAHLAHYHYPQYVSLSLMTGLVIVCVGVPAWLACSLAFSVQVKIERKLVMLMRHEGFASFKPKLYQYAMFVGSGMFEQLFYEALTSHNLHCYQVLLEFNTHYHLYDMENLQPDEHTRQREQVFSLWKGNSRFSSSYLEELKFLVEHTLNQYTHQINRAVYDCLILCFLEKSFWRSVDVGVWQSEFSQWFHYFMDSHDLSQNQAIDIMFAECDKLQSYQPLLHKYQFKNRIEQQLDVYDNTSDDNEENLPVLKI